MWNDGDDVQCMPDKNQTNSLVRAKQKTVCKSRYHTIDIFLGFFMLTLLFYMFGTNFSRYFLHSTTFDSSLQWNFCVFYSIAEDSLDWCDFEQFCCIVNINENRTFSLQITENCAEIEYALTLTIVVAWRQSLA